MNEDERKAKRREYERKYRKEHPEVHRRKTSKYRERHRIELRQSNRQYYQENREKKLESSKKSKEKNKDKVKAYRLKYQEENRAWLNAKALERYHADKTDHQKYYSTVLGKYRLMRNENIELFGGKCQVGTCGSTKVLQFHHLEYGEEGKLGAKPSVFRKIKFMEEVKAFPERFKMLCAVCHLAISGKEMYEERKKIHPDLADI